MKQLLASTLLILCAAPAWGSEVKEVVTPSGIKAWLVEEHSLPLFAVRIAFSDSGFAHDPAGKQGLSNMVTGMLMEGSGSMDSRAFNEALESRAIQMNVGTDEDKVEAMMETLSENKEQAFTYLGMALTSPRFDDSALDRVRSQAISLLTQEEQEPGYAAHRQWQKLAYGEHGYGRPSLGDKDSLAGITRADLKDFTGHYLTRENMMIAVSGDITPEELSRLLEANLAKLPEHFTPTTQVAEVKLPTEGKTVTVPFDIPQTMVLFGSQGLKRSDPDYFSGYVMNHILGGGGSLNSKLNQEIRAKRGLAYSVNTRIDPMSHGASWVGGFSTRNEKAGDAVKALMETLKDFAANGPTDAQLADAKKFLTGSFVLSLDSNANIASFLISMQENHLGRDYFTKRNAMVEAVTKKSVAAMAKRLIQPDHLQLVMVGKPAAATGAK